jgi:hypothetical protein
MAGSNAFLPWPALAFGDLKTQAKTASAEMKRLKEEIKAAGAAGTKLAPDVTKRLAEVEKIKKAAGEAVKAQKEAKDAYKGFKLMKGLAVAGVAKALSQGELDDAIVPLLLDKMTDPRLLKKVSKVGARLGFKNLGGTLAGAIPYVGLFHTAYQSIESIKPAMQADEKARFTVMESARKGYLSKAERAAWLETFEKYVGGGAEHANEMLKQYHETADELAKAGPEGMTTRAGRFAAARVQAAIAAKQAALGRTLTTDEQRRVGREAYVKMTNDYDWLSVATEQGWGKQTSAQTAKTLEDEAEKQALSKGANAPEMKSATQLYDERVARLTTAWQADNRRATTADLTRGPDKMSPETSATYALLAKGAADAYNTVVRGIVNGFTRERLPDRY